MNFLRVATFLVFMFLLVCDSKAAEQYTVLSEIFFPESKNWITLEQKYIANKKLINKYRGKLTQELDRQGIGAEFKEYGCSFEQRLFNDNSAKFYHIDVDKDGAKDIVYTGSAQCTEGEITAVWFKKNDGFEIRQTFFMQGRILKINTKNEPEFTTIRVACCAELVNEYKVVTLQSEDILDVEKTLKSLVMPKNYYKKPKRFTSSNQLSLRSAPKIENEYNQFYSETFETDVFGNIQKIYSESVSGSIIGHEVINQKRWYFVLIDAESSNFVVNNYIDSRVGWVIEDDLR